MTSTVVVGYAHDDLKDHAMKLASKLQVPISNEHYPRLCITPARLELQFEGFSPLFVDFSEKAWKKRHFAGKKQGLVQACKPTCGMKVVDATAGWGRDATILASFGAEVVMVEQNPIMFVLLQDGLRRIESTSSLKGSLSLYEGSAIKYLNELNPIDYPDVIYIDPMHPERTKTALVKKDMQALQALIGPAKFEDIETLLQGAIARVQQRVVLKWPKNAVMIQRPAYQYQGKTVRFDIFNPVSY